MFERAGMWRDNPMNVCLYDKAKRLITAILLILIGVGLGYAWRMYHEQRPVVLSLYNEPAPWTIMKTPDYRYVMDEDGEVRKVGI